MALKTTINPQFATVVLPRKFEVETAEKCMFLHLSKSMQQHEKQ